MPDVKVPFGFETQVSTDTTPDNWRDIKGYKADVTLNGITVYSKYYRNRDRVLSPWTETHPRPAHSQGDGALRQWLMDRQAALKDTAEDDRDAADRVLEAFAHRLALTLTWPDGA